MLLTFIYLFIYLRIYLHLLSFSFLLKPTYLFSVHIHIAWTGKCVSLTYNKFFKKWIFEIWPHSRHCQCYDRFIRDEWDECKCDEDTTKIEMWTMLNEGLIHSYCLKCMITKHCNKTLKPNAKIFTYTSWPHTKILAPLLLQVGFCVAPGPVELENLWEI